jgi:muramoyltetrapeptide carboxypeptidase
MSIFPLKNSRVSVFSPAGRADEAALQLGVEEARRLGLGAEIHAATGQKRDMAGDDEGRLASFLAAWNSGAELVISGRGGYGCLRLLDKLPWQELRAGPQPCLVGYSDLSVLQLAFLRHGIQAGVSGPMLAIDFARGLDDYSRDTFAQALDPRPAAIPLGMGVRCVHAGQAEGPLVPVTLSCLMMVLGTPYMPDLTGCILVLEDIGEPQRKIDGMLTRLRLAGELQKLSGLAFGDFSGCDQPEVLPELFAEAAAAVPGPVISGLPFGHCRPRLSLAVGRAVRLDAGAEIRMSYLK